MNSLAIVADILDGEFTIKRFRRSGSTVELVPENPKYRKITLPGQVLGFCKKLGVVESRFRVREGFSLREQRSGKFAGFSRGNALSGGQNRASLVLYCAPA